MKKLMFALAMGAAALLTNGAGAAEYGLTAGTQMPQWDLTRNDGRSYSTRELKGKVWILRRINALGGYNQDRNEVARFVAERPDIPVVPVVVASLQVDGKPLGKNRSMMGERTFRQSAGHSYPYYASEGLTPRPTNIPDIALRIPGTYIVGEDGKIVWAFTGINRAVSWRSQVDAVLICMGKASKEGMDVTTQNLVNFAVANNCKLPI